MTYRSYDYEERGEEKQQHPIDFFHQFGRLVVGKQYGK